MRKIFTVAALTVLVWSCSHKSTPSAAKTPATTPPVAATPAVPPTKPETIPPTGDNNAVAQGQTIYTSKCGRCHGLKTTTDYTAQRWVGIMESMAPKARLTDTEKANCLAYVQANAKK